MSSLSFVCPSRRKQPLRHEDLGVKTRIRGDRLGETDGLLSDGQAEGTTVNGLKTSTRESLSGKIMD